MGSDPPTIQERQRNPFDVDSSEPNGHGRHDSAPAAQAAPDWRLTQRWAKTIALLIPLCLIVAAHWVVHELSAPGEAVAPRDQARQLAGTLWQDLLKAGHVASVYREAYWRTANDNERLLVACKYGEKPLVEVLVRAGADVNAADHGTPNHRPVEWEGATPLMMGAKSGKRDVVEFLLAKGANVSAHDGFGETALHCAIRSGNEDLALRLLERGADANAAGTQSNATPYGLAFGKNMTRLQSALKERGAHF